MMDILLIFCVILLLKCGKTKDTSSYSSIGTDDFGTSLPPNQDRSVSFYPENLFRATLGENSEERAAEAGKDVTYFTGTSNNQTPGNNGNGGNLPKKTRQNRRHKKHHRKNKVFRRCIKRPSENCIKKMFGNFLTNSVMNKLQYSILRNNGLNGNTGPGISPIVFNNMHPDFSSPTDNIPRDIQGDGPMPNNIEPEFPGHNLMAMGIQGNRGSQNTQENSWIDINRPKQKIERWVNYMLNGNDGPHNIPPTNMPNINDNNDNSPKMFNEGGQDNNNMPIGDIMQYNYNVQKGFNGGFNENNNSPKYTPERIANNNNPGNFPIDSLNNFANDISSIPDNIPDRNFMMNENNNQRHDNFPDGRIPTMQNDNIAPKMFNEGINVNNNLPRNIPNFQDGNVPKVFNEGLNINNNLPGNNPNFKDRNAPKMFNGDLNVNSNLPSNNPSFQNFQSNEPNNIYNNNPVNKPNVIYQTSNFNDNRMPSNNVPSNMNFGNNVAANNNPPNGLDKTSVDSLTNIFNSDDKLINKVFNEDKDYTNKIRYHKLPNDPNVNIPPNNYNKLANSNNNNNFNDMAGMVAGNTRGDIGDNTLASVVRASIKDDKQISDSVNSFQDEDTKVQNNMSWD